MKIQSSKLRQKRNPHTYLSNSMGISSQPDDLLILFILETAVLSSFDVNGFDISLGGVSGIGSAFLWKILVK